MKRVLFFIFILVFSWGTWGNTPGEYRDQVLQKDLPRSLLWMGTLTQLEPSEQLREYFLQALPLNQKNHQMGISVKGSIERMILLLEGVQYLPQAQNTSPEFQNKRQRTLKALQTTLEMIDRFQFGEAPEVLLEVWRSPEIQDFEKFSAEVLEVYTELQALIHEPVHATESEIPSVKAPEASTQAIEVVGTDISLHDDSFELQRFNSYMQSGEVGQVAEECLTATEWMTDKAAFCQSDDDLDCDRRYARQCKKLQ